MNMHINAVIARELDEGAQFGLSIKFDPVRIDAGAIVQYDIIMPAFMPAYDTVPEGVLTPVAADLSGKGRDNLVPYLAWLQAEAIRVGVPQWKNHPNDVVRAFAAIAETAITMPGLRPLPAKWQQSDRRSIGGREVHRSWYKYLPYKAQGMTTPAAELTLSGGLPAFAAVAEPSVVRGGADMGVSHAGTADAKVYITQFLGEASSTATAVATKCVITPNNPAMWATIVRMAASGNKAPEIHTEAVSGSVAVPAIGGMVL